MRKTAAVLFALVCMAYIAGCGGSSATATTTYDVTTPIPTPYPAVLGGAKQVGALPFNNYSVTTFAGSSAGFTDSPTAGIATFNRPIAVTSDGTDLYVADYFNNAIRRINIATGNVTTIAGNTAGLAGSADGNGVAATFNRPSGITIDENNNLYVADTNNYTIRKIANPTGPVGTAVVTTLAGAVGAAGSVDAAIGTNARFNVLNGITTDGKNLYVTDSSNTIRKIVLPPPGTVPSGPVTTLAGASGIAGSIDDIKDAARFNQPARITTNGPSLFVTDFGNNSIRKLDLATGTVTTIAGKFGPISTTDSVSGRDARFNQPNGITTDGINLYVTDSFDNTVRKIVIDSGIPGDVFSGAVTTIAGTAGIAGSTNATGTAASFNTPMDITTDGTSLFIADIENHRIRKIH